MKKPGVKKVKRFEWLSDIIGKHGLMYGAEVGCYKGVTTQHLLRMHRTLKIIAVDLWECRPEVFGTRELSRRVNENQEAIRQEFIQRTTAYEKRVKILRGISWEMAEEVPDESLDFIFIDADHGYDAVKKDIAAWAPKVKKGGLISGHDINLPGVYDAVVEAFGTDSHAAGFDQCWYVWKK